MTWAWGIASPPAALADFNEDGNQDIALTIGNNAVVIMLGDGAGRFTRTGDNGARR